MPSATSSHGPWLRPEIVTLAPASAKLSAIARPMPRDDPVTTATLPLRSNSFIGLSLVDPLDGPLVSPIASAPHPYPLPARGERESPGHFAHLAPNTLAPLPGRGGPAPSGAGG